MNYNYNPALTYEDYVRCAPCASTNYNGDVKACCWTDDTVRSVRINELQRGC